MHIAVCCVPVGPLRKENAHQSEMVSQLLFGEPVHVMETTKGEWAKVKCQYDEYEGWCSLSHLLIIEEDHCSTFRENLTAYWSSMTHFDGKRMRLPLGASITGLRKGKSVYGDHVVQYSGRLWHPSKHAATARQIRRFALLFLNTPYLWGGKSIFGTDCSGYTQTLFRFFKVPLLRDAHQQASQGRPVQGLQEAVCGDLAFFGEDLKQITHVGVVLNKQEIIHASGKVRIDRLTDKGIVEQESKKQTHTLQFIKRLF